EAGGGRDSQAGSPNRPVGGRNRRGVGGDAFPGALSRRGGVCFHRGRIPDEARGFGGRNGGGGDRGGRRGGRGGRSTLAPAPTRPRALGGGVVTRFEAALPQLARIDEDAPLAGRTVESVVSEGKWLFIRFSGGLILLTHMLMSGSWHIYRPGERWQRPRMD